MNRTKKHAVSPFLVSVTLVLSLAWTLTLVAASPQESTAAPGSTAPASASSGPAADSVVPRLIQFSGVVKDATGKVTTGSVSLTFSLYEFQEGGSPLWVETQKAQLDEQGHYTVLLGATQPDGLPLDLFTTGKARWLGVQPQLSGEGEEPRVVLVGMPYALKAADADTLGGKPASAYLTTDTRASGPETPASASTVAATQALNQALTAASNAQSQGPLTVSGSGTTNFIPIWTNSTTLGNSTIFETSKKVGIGNTSPAATLDVSGGAFIRGAFRLPGTGTANATEGFNSQPSDWLASAFNSGTKAAVNQDFRWQAEPVNNNTASPSGKFNLLFASGSNAPAETGLSISHRGVITFASGQTFPGAGTITGVTAGTDLTGGGTSGNVTLNLDTTKVPQLNTANTFTGNQSVTGNVSATGSVSGSSASLSGNVSAGGNVAASGSVSASGNVSASGSISGSSASFSGNSSSSPIVTVAQSNTNEYGLWVSSANLGLLASTSGEAALVADATGSGSLVGVVGNNSSANNFAAGVLGQDFGDSGENFGVQGFAQSPVGAGVLGTDSSSSGLGVFFGGVYGLGVWGDTGLAGGSGISVLATADNNYALQAHNNSPSGYVTAYFENTESSSPTAPILETNNNPFGGFCVIDVSGNLSCTGSITEFAGPLSNNRKVALYAVEAPENWFEDFGSGRLANGSATVALEPTFGETVNTGMEYHVFLTANGECEGLYVANKTPQGFEVHEMHGGQSNVAFDYRIVAHRKGYENVRLADMTERFQKPAIRRRTTPGPKNPLPVPLPGPAAGAVKGQPTALHR